jgi:hypothetical protein
MKRCEGIILQGCGGELQEWVDGVNEMLAKEGILLNESKFSKIDAFKHDDLTNLLFHLTDDVKLNIGKLAMWRLRTHGVFGGTWLSDYVPNRLGGFNQSAFEKQVERLYTSNTEVSSDFQCDQTLGFPTSLCWNREEGKAWLALKESMIDDDLDMVQFDKGVEEFGIRDCFDIDDFNNLLNELGEDAYQTAYMHSDDEPFDLA